MRLLFLCLTTFLLLTAPLTARADERILNYVSDIVVQPDSSLLVRETIKVKAEWQKIKRGIYRDFPTLYTTTLGTQVKVGFEIVSITRDGHPDHYHTEMQQNGERIYIGNENYYLPKGIYTYEITYRTTRQLGYFEQHDELYWNVTGNGWEFPIDKATARVFLPDNADILQHSAYTGKEGEREQHYTVIQPASHQITFEATRPLKAGEGLTIVVGWPKGIVTQPAWDTYFWEDYQSLIIPGLLFLLLLGYYANAWHKVGRDPKKGTIIPRFKPPNRLAPAAVRYISEWKKVGTKKGRIGKAIFITLFALPFFAGELFGIGLLVASGSPVSVLFMLGFVGINILFYYLLKAPTMAGREVMDAIEGFKMYLSTAEKHRLETLHPPRMTPQRFEKYLPYALALDVEQQWSEQFANTVPKAVTKQHRTKWYSGHSPYITGALGGALCSSLASSISSASVAPGSSSGGGGFSGGGGGGGGGGGW